MKSQTRSQLVRAGILGLALVMAGSAMAASPFESRRISRLPADTIALSQEVMARITRALLDTDLRALLALPVQRARARAVRVYNRNPVLDGSPVLRSTFDSGRIPIPAFSPIEHSANLYTYPR